MGESSRERLGMMCGVAVKRILARISIHLLNCIRLTA